MILPRLIVAIVLTGTSCQMHPIVDAVALAKGLLCGGAIAAYPVHYFKTSCASYDNAEALDAEENIPTDSFEYRRAEILIPGMHMHGKPVRMKYSTKTCHNGMVNGKNAFYLLFNKASVEKGQSLVDAYYSKSYNGAITMDLRHEVGHMKNNDSHPALDGVASLGAFCVGGIAHYILRLGLHRIGIPYANFAALPGAVGSTWAALHAREYWHEYKADEDAYQKGTYNEVVSGIVSHAIRHRVKEIRGSGSIIEYVKLQLTDPHSSNWARAHRGNVVFEKRFGARVNMPSLYNNLVESLNINASL